MYWFIRVPDSLDRMLLKNSSTKGSTMVHISDFPVASDKKNDLDSRKKLPFQDAGSQVGPGVFWTTGAASRSFLV